MSAGLEDDRARRKKRTGLLVATFLPIAAGVGGDGWVDVSKAVFGRVVSGAPWPADVGVAVLLLLGGTALTALLLWRLVSLGQDYISSRARITTEEEGSRKVMIMGFSPLGTEDLEYAKRLAKEWTAEGVAQPADRFASPKAQKKSLEDRVKRLLETMDPANRPEVDSLKKEIKEVEKRIAGTSWQQNVRALWRVRDVLKHVIVIVPKSGGDQQFETFKNFLVELFAKNGIDLRVDRVRGPEAKPLDPVGHEDYRELQVQLRAALDMAEREYKVGARDICIDITAGLKPFSVAAAVVTLNRRLIFSYVNAAGEVKFYDAELDFGRIPGA